MLGRVDASEAEVWGTVVETGRGSLPFALVHGEPLVACAAWALGEAGVTVVDLTTQWSAVAGSGAAFVLHDSLCPLTPPEFLAACARRAVERSAVVVGVRPVTDTVKEVDGPYVAGTVDRAGLLQVASPVVLPASVVAALGEPETLDFPELVALLARRFPVELLEAPVGARRVADRADLPVLEELTHRPSQSVP